ncbi:MAG: hypothetical protein MI975_19745 [Cytophagales bacterium]|nr:hypothetical protein [Cytophagales bacterium]
MIENLFLSSKGMEMRKKEIETYCPESRTDWRNWLEKNHQSKQSVWLVYFKSSTKVANTLGLLSATFTAVLPGMLIDLII